MTCKILTPLLLAVFLINYPGDTCHSQVLNHPSTTNFKTKNSQAGGYALAKWAVNDPFEQKVFIENNEGQFDGKTSSDKGKILFSARINEVYLYFSSTGITYRYDKYPELKNDRRENEEKGSAEIKTIQPESHFFSITWEGANQQTDVLAEDEVSFYYTYPKGNKHTTIAHAFRKLLYKNLYPGIDIEYSFPEDKKGLEYSVIVHPGADLSLVKMLYPDAGKIKMSSEGNIESESSFGQFVDHAPAKTYYADGVGIANCSFLLSGNEASFAANYDHRKTLAIDPWMVNPGFTNFDAGYDICYDLKGNVYAYGSYSPYQEIKINSAGKIQWTYSIPNPDVQYGDFAVDEATGISYDGSCSNPLIYKVDTAGIQTNSYLIGNTMDELWRMGFNKCENQLVIAGGGVGLINQVCLLDTGLTVFQPFNVLATTEAHHDVSLFTIDLNNKYIYLAFMQSNTFTSFNNVIVQCALSKPTTVLYDVADGYSFYEGANTIHYIDGVSGHTASMNGAVTSPNWLYLYDGATLTRFNKNNGSLVTTKTISGTSGTWGGIDIDLCDNIYLANADTIMVYDTSLNNTGKILAPGNVYDLHIAPDNTLIAAGLNFVSSFSITTNAVSVSINSVPSSCIASTGKATATLKGCSNDSSLYTYQWSDGVTTQTDTGLAPGKYTVFISAGCDFIFSDSITISGSSGGGMSVSAVSLTNVLCNGDNNGSASVTVKGGISPFTYNWAVIGGTTAMATNLSAGTYTIAVKDSKGCSLIDSVIITQPAKIVPAISGKDTICEGQSMVLTAGGGGTYLWSNGSTSGFITVYPAKDTSYTLKVSNGKCFADTTIGITVKPISGTINGPFTACAGDSIRLNVSGAGTYLWSTGSTANSIIVYPGHDSAFNVTINNNGCSEKLSTLVIISSPSLYACCDTLISSGDSVLINASGGISYKWLPPTGLSCTTCPAPFANPAITTTYTVSAKDSAGCLAERIITVTVETPCMASLLVPTIFTPNGDGINDEFIINASLASAYSIIIYDRWGKVMYQSSNPTVYWNGNTLSGTKASDGIYYYIIKATCQSNNFDKKGYVQLIR